MFITRQAYQAQSLLSLRVRPLARRPLALSVVRGQSDIVEQRKSSEWPWNLVGARYAESRHMAGRGPGNFAAEKLDRSAAGRERARDQIENRALARTIRTYQPEDFAFGHVEGNAIDGLEAAENLGDPLDAQHS